MSEYIFFSFKKEGNPMKNVKFRRSFGKVKEIASLFLSVAMMFGLFSCSNEVETEYVDKYVDKIYASAPTFTAEKTAKEDGTVTVSVTIASATEGAAIYYTTDGTLPSTESAEYSAPLSFTADATIKAIAVKEGIENSPVAIATVSIAEKKIINYVA